MDFLFFVRILFYIVFLSKEYNNNFRLNGFLKYFVKTTLFKKILLRQNDFHFSSASLPTVPMEHEDFAALRVASKLLSLKFLHGEIRYFSF